MLTLKLLLLLAAQIPAAPDFRDPFFIFFDRGSAELGSEQLDLVNNAATSARRTGSKRLEVVGHADRQGSSSYNLLLARRRADAVTAALAERGIPASAIAVEGVGEDKPLVATEDGIGEPMNRYVTIMIW